MNEDAPKSRRASADRRNSATVFSRRTLDDYQSGNLRMVDFLSECGIHNTGRRFSPLSGSIPIGFRARKSTCGTISNNAIELYSPIV